MITKNDLALAAFEEARISGLTVTPSPTEMVSVIKKLDRMVLSWQNLGLCLSYIRSEGFNDINPLQDSGLNDTSAQAVILNLTKMICPMYGKAIHPQTSGEARIAYLGLFDVELTMREADPYQPTGSGHHIGRYYSPRFQAADTNAPSDCATQDIKLGETDSYSVDFNPYLNEVDSETIVSYVIDSADGVVIGDHANTDGLGVINFFATGGQVGVFNVVITITTQTRTNPETIVFNVTKT